MLSAHRRFCDCSIQATADIHLFRGDTEPALRLLQEVVSLCRDSGDIEDQVDAQIRIARLWVLRSEADEAETSAKAALQAAKGNDLAEAQASLGMARVLMAKKDLPGAKAQAANAEKLFKTCGHRSGELTALSLTWSAMLEEGGAAQMVQAAKKAAEAFKAAGDQQCAAEAYLEASAASKKHGQPESADTATAALQLFRQLGHTSGEVKALHALSAAERARGQVAESVKAAVDVVSLYQRRGDTCGQAEATCELAKVHLGLGLLKDALSEVGEARLLFQKVGQPQIQEAAVLVEVGVPTLMAMDDPPKAVAMAEDAAKLYRALGDRKGEAAALSACAKVCVQQGDNAAALQAARQAVAVLSRARLAREEAEAIHLIARVYAIRREPREAVSSAAQALSLLRRPGDEADRSDVLMTASYAHSMAGPLNNIKRYLSSPTCQSWKLQGLESEGAVGAAEEAVALCRRIGDKTRLASALHALAEALLLKRDFGQAVDTAEEALQLPGLDPMLQAHLSSVSAYGRLAWSQAKKKGLRANPKQLLQKAKAASDILLASGDRRFEAEAKFLMAKAQLKADNVEAANKEAMAAYDFYATLRDGQGLGWTGLLYSSCLLRSPAKMMTSGITSITSKEVEMPQYDGALQAALVAHSTFRRCGDEEGVEAALTAIHEIRSSMGGLSFILAVQLQTGDCSVCCIYGCVWPMPPAFSSAPPVSVNPYHAMRSVDLTFESSWRRTGGRPPSSVARSEIVVLLGAHFGARDCLEAFVAEVFSALRRRQAIKCFSSGHWGTGQAKAKAAVQLMEGMQEACVPDLDLALLLGGLCLAQAASGCWAEALSLCCKRSADIADEILKDRLLHGWLEEANAFTPGDVVQFTGAHCAQLTGLVMGPSAEFGSWHVRVTGPATEAAAAPGPLEAATPMPKAVEVAGEVLEVRESEATLLTLRLSDEQQLRWKELEGEVPELFQKRMNSGNEVVLHAEKMDYQLQRTQQAALHAEKTDVADSGLPLEQTFAATLYDCILEHHQSCGTQAEMVVDVLGCRPALELDDPVRALTAMIKASRVSAISASSEQATLCLKTLIVRCLAEVESGDVDVTVCVAEECVVQKFRRPNPFEDYKNIQDVDGRSLVLEVKLPGRTDRSVSRPVIEKACDVSHALGNNEVKIWDGVWAGFGLTRTGWRPGGGRHEIMYDRLKLYAKMWRPTLEVLSRCQRGLLACGPDTRTAGSNDFAEQGSFAVFLTSGDVIFSGRAGQGGEAAPVPLASAHLTVILPKLRVGETCVLQRSALASTLTGVEASLSPRCNEAFMECTSPVFYVQVSLKRGVLKFANGADSANDGLHVVCRETLLYVCCFRFKKEFSASLAKWLKHVNAWPWRLSETRAPPSETFDPEAGRRLSFSEILDACMRRFSELLGRRTSRYSVVTWLDACPGVVQFPQGKLQPEQLRLGFLICRLQWQVLVCTSLLTMMPWEAANHGPREVRRFACAGAWDSCFPLLDRSALASIENMDNRFDRKAWHNVKALLCSECRSTSQRGRFWPLCSASIGGPVT
ncbi:TTC28 [Symbiodinium natans]|uniref:TTC28 protein n=1 Tax=Symbiodinium natans TaxID=878477 RepID=A0A812J516_9DINO|nr:TTC28 [Symbiodinium natans]